MVIITEPSGQLYITTKSYLNDLKSSDQGQNDLTE